MKDDKKKKKLQPPVKPEMKVAPAVKYPSMQNTSIDNTGDLFARWGKAKSLQKRQNRR